MQRYTPTGYVEGLCWLYCTGGTCPHFRTTGRDFGDKGGCHTLPSWGSWAVTAEFARYLPRLWPCYRCRPSGPMLLVCTGKQPWWGNGPVPLVRPLIYKFFLKLTQALLKVERAYYISRHMSVLIGSQKAGTNSCNKYSTKHIMMQG